MSIFFSFHHVFIHSYLHENAHACDLSACFTSLKPYEQWSRNDRTPDWRCAFDDNESMELNDSQICQLCDHFTWKSMTLILRQLIHRERSINEFLYSPQAHGNLCIVFSDKSYTPVHTCHEVSIKSTCGISPLGYWGLSLFAVLSWQHWTMWNGKWMWGN